MQITASARSAKKPGLVCPLCGKPRGRAFRPFCSASCADVDLGRWLGGTYVIATGDTIDKDTEK